MEKETVYSNTYVRYGVYIHLDCGFGGIIKNGMEAVAESGRNLVGKSQILSDSRELAG